MRKCAGAFVLVWLALFLADLHSAAGADEKPATTIYLPAYSEATAVPVRFIAEAPSLDLSVISSAPLNPDRPLLLIVEPSSYPLSQLQKRISEIIAALTAEVANRPTLKVRLGVPALDGILFDLPGNATAMPGDTVAAIMRLMPESETEQGNDPARILDFVSLLLQKAETDGGPVDCILIGKDRPFAPGAEYVHSSAERRLLEVCRRKGSVVHAYMERAGDMTAVCAATGGIVVNGEEQAAQAIGRVLGARERGYLLAVQQKALATALGRFELTIKAEDRHGSRTILHAPVAIWRTPDDSSAPEYESVREALEWIERARRAAETGDAGTALRFIQNAVQLDPCNPDVFYFSARYALEAGEPDLAEAHVNKAMEFVPRTERLLVLYGEILRTQGESAQALATFKSLSPEAVPASDAFRLTSARLLSSLGRNDEAEDLYAGLTKPGHESSQAHAEYGCLLWQLGKEQPAAEHLQFALAGDPQNVTSMLCTADMASAHGRVQEALDTGSRAIKLHPDNPDAYLQVGKIHARALHWESALASFQDAAKISPTRTDILIHLAEAELQVGQGREAVETMRGVLLINPTDANASRRIAELFTRAGAFVNAATVLEESAARMPGNAQELYREAAALRERIEQYGQALLDYRALQSPPGVRNAGPDQDFSSHLAYLSLMVKRNAERLTGASPPGAAASGILVPGGVSLASNMLGLPPESLKDTGATGRILSLILDSMPESRLRMSPLVRLLQDYERLLRHMGAKGLLPAAFDRTKRMEFVFPLAGNASDTEHIRKFLSFFGVKYSSVQKGGKRAISLKVSQDALMQQRQLLLRVLGVDMESRNIRELRFSLGDETLPSIIDGAQVQGRILAQPGGDSRLLFPTLIQRADAMRLYLALETCAVPLREALLKVFSAKELIALTPNIGMFGRSIDIREGRMVLPGSGQAWEKLLGVTQSDPHVFLRSFFEYGKGKLPYIYFALAGASPAVQRYFTASAQNLDELSKAVIPAIPVRGAAAWSEWARLIHILSADEHGLFFPLDQRFGPYLFPGRPRPGPNAGRDNSPLRVSVKELASLAQGGANTGSPSGKPGAAFIEFLEFLQAARPEILTDSAIEAIMRNPADAAVCLDLIWEVNAPPDLLVSYLALCRELANAGNSGWNPNRSRTCQSIFFLISKFCREGVLEPEGGRRLLQSALMSFAASNEETFLFSVSEFLTSVLMPELARSLRLAADSPGLMEEALAGSPARKAFLFGGVPIIEDDHSEQLQRIRSVLRLQNLASINDLLQAVQLTRKIGSSHGPHFDWLQSLAETIRKLPAPVPAGASVPVKDKTQPSPRPGYRDVSKELEVLSVLTSGEGYQKRTPEALKRAAAVLHAELGMALLGECYAYYATPQTATLSYDPDFARKHEFHRPGQVPAAWLPAGIVEEQDTERASAIAGSLSGLGFQIRHLETAASAQSFGKKDWSGIVPAILSGIRATPRALRTDRAQEYVALAVRVGRELIAICLSTPSTGGWCEQNMSALISPFRREQVTTLAGNGNVAGAIDLFSPSELFFWGEAFLLATDVLPRRACGRLSPSGCNADRAKPPEITGVALHRLRELVPAPESPEWKRFEKEVDQYGCSLWKRLGIAESSFQFCDSYEHLQDGSQQDLLFDRIIDVKIRLAETSYAAGVPASVDAMLGELALQNLVADPASALVGTWRDVMQEIARLGPWDVGGWMDELLNRGSLAVYPGKSTEKPEEF